MKKNLLLSLLFCLSYLTSEAQWVLQSSGFQVPSRGIKYICAVDTNVVWATGYDGSQANAPQIQDFTRTTNGGLTWKARSIPGYPNDGMAMISAVDSMNAWIPIWYANGGGTILRTTNGGLTWAPQPTAAFNAPNGFPNVVHFWNLNEGFCMGDPNGGYFEIYTTVDGGTTWVRVPQANIPPNTSGEYGTTGLYSVVGDIVWFTTGKGRVYKSIDRGHHWTVALVTSTSDQMQVSFRDANHGLVKINASPYNTYYTTDGGATWQQLMFSGTFYANDFCYVPGTASTYLSVGSDYVNSFQGTSYSTDDGLNWNVIPLSDTTQFLTLDFVDVNHGWAGAFNTDSVNGGMWKYTGNIFVFDSCAGFAAFFSQSADTLDLNTSGLCTFTDLSTGNPTAWNWDFGDLSSSASQSPSHTYTATGTYTVGLTATKGSACASSYAETVVVINTSNIEKYSDGPAIEIWPNPAQDYLHISSAATISNIEIYNSFGQMVYINQAGETRSDINISNLLSGVYFIRISTAQGHSVGRFIVER